MAIQYCTISGYFNRFNGDPIPGEKIIIKRVGTSAGIISSQHTIYKTNAQGFFSFELPCSSTAYIYANVVGLDSFAVGTPIYVPNAPSANLLSLIDPGTTFPTVIPALYSDDGLKTSLSAHTADSSIHFTVESLNLGQFATSANLTNHVNDASIHLTTASLTAFSNSNAGLTGVIGQLAIFSSSGEAIGYSTLTSNGNNLFVSGSISAGSISSQTISTPTLSNGTAFFQPATQWVGGNIAIKATSFFFETSNVERLKLSSNGNIGIGDTNPASKLSVNGDISISGNVVATGAITAYNFSSSTTAVTSDNQLITKAYLDSITASLGGGMTLKYITLTGSSTGDIHLSNAISWNVSKANINYIRVDTSSSAWNMYLLQNDNGYAINDAVIPALQITNNGFQNQVIYLNHAYWDEDLSNEVHLYWNSLSGSVTANIYVVGTELK